MTPKPIQIPHIPPRSAKRRGRKVPAVPYCEKRIVYQYHGVTNAARALGIRCTTMSAFLNGRMVSRTLFQRVYAQFPQLISPELVDAYLQASRLDQTRPEAAAEEDTLRGGSGGIRATTRK